MDMYEKKHGMMQELLAMLKKHASDEVDGGLKRPEGEGDMHGIQAERVEMADHDMDHPTPEHDVVTHEMHTGGIVDKVSPEVHPPMESEQGHPDKEGSAHEEASEPEAERIAEGDITPMPGDKYPEAESEPPSMFASFLSRKKKK
jgi:hypothetical protein